jgi:plastocyanin domain-containing protein
MRRSRLVVNAAVGVTFTSRAAYIHMKLRTLLIPLWVAFAGAAAADSAPKDPARIPIEVTKRGFNPDSISVPAKKKVTLVFTRTTDVGCMKSVVVTMDDGKKVERELPLDKPVEVAVTFPKAGTLGYACSMDMVKGTIVVQ